MPETNVSKAIGVAGEYWVASTILFQGSEEGYRVCTVDVDDLGTDLFIAKYTNGILVKTYEVQVKQYELCSIIILVQHFHLKGLFIMD